MRSLGMTPVYGGSVTDLCMLDAVSLAGMLRRGEVSAREVVLAHIARI